jgi:transglutaminase-like putative cysteine protease
MWTVGILVTISGLCFIIRSKILHRSDLPPGESIWRLTYDIDLPQIQAGKIQIAIPDNTAHSRVFREAFSHQGIWMDILRSKRTLGREAIVVPIVGHSQGRFIAQFDIYLKPDKEEKASKAQLSAEEIAHYLRPETAIQTESPQISNTLNQLQNATTTKSELLDLIFDYCSENIIQAGRSGVSDALSVLERGRGSTLGRARAMVALCRAGKIPARLVTGFLLESHRDPQTHYWVEVLSKRAWLPYDPENGYTGHLPISFLPVSRDDAEIVKAPNISDYRARYSGHRLLPPPALVALPKSRLANIVDLTRLPPSMQEILALILLLPLGALITAVFRNLIGIQTFGTFAPSLVALSFVQADWRTGAVVFFVVLGIGILARSLLNKLKLLMVPRLGIILTLVVLCMIMAVSLLDYLGLTPSASAVLLPMVILTMMIERFNVTAEEDSYRQAFKTFAGTMVVALCCLLVLRVETVARVVLTFPELQLLSAAGLFLIGRYSGYRLTELWRFRDFA